MIVVPGCRILIRPFKVEENDEIVRSAKKFGIVLTEQDERKHQTKVDKGVVMAIGPKASEEYTQGMRVGDTIGFTTYGGKFVRDLNSEEDMLIINDEDVICIFKEAK